MGAWTSKQAWYVWYRNKRYRFNEIQANDEYGPLLSCFGARHMDARRTMNLIFMEKLEDQKKLFDIKKQNAERKYNELRRELKSMLDTEIKIIGKMDRSQAEKLVKDKKFINFTKQFLAKEREVTSQQKKVNQFQSTLQRNRQDMNDCIATEEQFESGEEPLNFESHARSMRMALEGKRTAVSNSDSTAERDALRDTLADIEDAEGQIVESENVDSAAMDRMLKLLFSEKTRDSEFEDVQEQQLRSSQKGKNKLGVRINSMNSNNNNNNNNDSIQEDDDEEMLIFSSDNNKGKKGMKGFSDDNF